MSAPTLTWLDKAALITVGAGAAGKILLWGLGASLDMAAPPAWMGLVLAGFACLSFVAFDLVLASVVVDARQHGLRWAGVVAVGGAASAAACIALEVAGVVNWPALHAAPAVTMLLYALHLMWPYPQPAASPAVEAAPLAAPAAETPQAMPPITQAVQVNVAPAAALPDTVAAFIRAHAASRAELPAPKLAALLETSPDTVRRALAAAEVAVDEAGAV